MSRQARVGALLIDYLLISAWIGLLALGAFLVHRITGSLPDWLAIGGALGAELFGFVLLVLPVGIYLYTTESSPRHATIGKRALRLHVVDARTGNPPTRHQVLIRTIVKLIPWELAHFFVWQLVARPTNTPPWIITGLAAANVVPVAYLLTVVLRKDARAPHDLAAGTTVRSIRPAGQSRGGPGGEAPPGGVRGLHPR